MRPAPQRRVADTLLVSPRNYADRPAADPALHETRQEVPRLPAGPDGGGLAGSLGSDLPLDPRPRIGRDDSQLGQRRPDPFRLGPRDVTVAVRARDLLKL